MGLGSLFGAASTTATGWGAASAAASSAATTASTAVTGAGIMSTISSIAPYALMGLSALSSVKQAQAQSGSGDAAARAAEYNAQVNEYNARVMEEEANAAELAANYKTDAEYREAKRLLGRQRTLYAKGGVIINEGSPLLTMAEDAGLAEKDRYMNWYSGQVSKRGYLNQAKVYRSNASFNRYSGSVAQNTADNAATGTLISGLGNLGKSYYYSSLGRGLHA